MNLEAADWFFWIKTGPSDRVLKHISKLWYCKNVGGILELMRTHWLLKEDSAP
jgi:hypothetical protein